MKRISISIFCVLCFLFAPAVAGAQRLTAGYISKDLNYLPFFIGLKKNLYAKEGIQVDLVSIGRADVQLQALVAVSLTSPISMPTTFIVWNERTNGNLKVAAGSSNAAPYLLIGAKNIKKIDDLKGQRLGVASLTGGATSICSLT